MKCDYKLTYYLNGNPKTFRVPNLDVDENTTDEDIKVQLKDIFMSVINNPQHEMYNDVNNLAKTGLVMQSLAIRELPSKVLLSKAGIEQNLNKTEHDGNTKLVDLSAHLSTATHPYKGIMKKLLADSDLTLPVINIIAERYTQNDEVNGHAGSAFGVYTVGNKGIDSIDIYTGEDTGDLDILNTNNEITRIVAKQLLNYRVNRMLEKWYMKDSKNFNDFMGHLKENLGIYNSMGSFNKQYPNVSDLLQYSKVLFTNVLTNKELAKTISTGPFAGKPTSAFNYMANTIAEIIPVGKQQSNNLVKLLNQFYNMEVIDARTNGSTDEDEDLPFSKEFESNSPNGYKKSEKADKELIKALTDKLGTMYNIPFNLMNSQEIADQFDTTPNSRLLFSEQRAFVKDGQIYLNTDKASLAEPIHELGHIVLAGLKASNNDLYSSIISKFSAHPDYEQISKYYPELSPDQQTEEVFVTTLGEMFNGRIARPETANWEADNRSFLGKVIDSIKNFFAELFGIDSRRFFDLSANELMAMSFDDIHNHFGNSILNGTFTSVAELTDLKTNLMQDGEYLNSREGGRSSLYQSFDIVGLDDSTASSLWIKTRSPNFIKWAGDSLITNEDGEPMLFARQPDSQDFYIPNDLTQLSDLVYLKNAVADGDNNFKVLAPSQVRSIYNAGYLENPAMMEIDMVERTAIQNGIALNGNKSTMDRSRAKLATEFPDYEFEVRQGFGSNYFIDYYLAVDPQIKALREQLMKNKNITEVC